MPAWHLLCAVVQIVAPAPYYIPKLLSALFGGLSPALVFLLARRLSGRESAGWIAWGIAAIQPLHAMYSSTAMAEAFCGFWILLAAFAFLRSDTTNRRLLVAAAALLPVALTRYEIWVVLPVISALALLQRRAGTSTLILSTAILAAGPLVWFGINLGATGSAVAFLQSHGSYISHVFEFDLLRADRGPLGVARHVSAVGMAGSFTVTALCLYGFVRCRDRETRALAAIVGVHLCFMIVLWAFRLQVGYARHYMTLGLVLAAVAAVTLERLPRKRIAATLLVLELSLLSFFHAYRATWPARLREAAAYVRVRTGTVYCDEPGVTVLSGLSPARFVNAQGAQHTREAMLDHMRAHGVRWVVYADVDYSPLSELFPPMRRGGEYVPPFRLVYTPPSNIRFIPAIRVYELEDRD